MFADGRAILQGKLLDPRGDHFGIHPKGIPLPTTLPDAALSLEREHEIGDAL